MSDSPNDSPRHDGDGAARPAATGRPAAAHGVERGGGGGAGSGADAARGRYVGAHRAASGPSGGPVHAGAPSGSRWWLVGGGVVVLAVIVGLFFVGLRMGAAGDGGNGGEAARLGSATDAGDGVGASGSPAGDGSPAGAATASPTSPGAAAAAGADAAADAVAPPGPLAPGVHDWDALHGGECLSGYSSPWEPQYTVVDCAGDHTAQLVSRGAFAEDAAAPYPGEAELISRLNLLCTAPAVLDYAAAQAVPDIQWQAAYPADEGRWATGDRSYFCFFSRTSGEALGGTLVATPAG